jgi:organic hydroperoxide reductase OsmC/OhrA
MARTHTYDIGIEWTGNTGSGTADYRGYRRTHQVRAAGRPDIAGTSDPAFRGETDRWNPEQLLVVSLSQCHMLWFLHLASEAGVVVTAYADDAIGTMVQDADGGGGQFTEVVLRPRVTVADPSMREPAHALHARVGEVCFIARSVNFPVRHEPTTLVAADASG